MNIIWEKLYLTIKDIFVILYAMQVNMHTCSLLTINVVSQSPKGGAEYV